MITHKHEYPEGRNRSLLKNFIFVAAVVVGWCFSLKIVDAARVKRDTERSGTDTRSVLCQ